MLTLFLNPPCAHTQEHKHLRKTLTKTHMHTYKLLQNMSEELLKINSHPQGGKFLTDLSLK